MAKQTNRQKPNAGSAAKAGGSNAGALQFTRRNGIFAGAGLVCVVGGFALLAQGSITLAPVLLVLGYVVFLPLAIIL